MIVIVGSFPIKPEKIEEATAAALTMAAATQQEESCITYQFYSDLADPNTLFIFEEWENAETLTAHGKTPHMTEFRRIIPQVAAGPGKLKKYEISSAEPLPLVWKAQQARQQRK